MVVKVPRHHIGFHRDGKRMNAHPGKPFDFKQGEIDEILKVNKDALRDPVMEKVGQPAADTRDIDPNIVKDLSDQQADAQNAPSEDDEI